MKELTYTHAEMIKISDEAKRLVLSEVEDRVKGNIARQLGDFNLISREGVLIDIDAVRADNGLAK